MDIRVFTPNELPTALRALRRVAPSPRGAEYCAAIAEIHQTICDLSEAPAGPAEVAAVITRPHARLRLVQLAEIAALVDGMPTPAAARMVRDLAVALAVREPGLAVIRQLAAGRRLVARLLMVRRIFGRVAGDAIQREGLRGLRRLIGALWFRGGADPTLLARYRGLGQLPAGTLGHAVFEHWTENRFQFPGEPGAIPEQLIFHDIGHLLAGTSTEPGDEIQQAAFQAGFVRRDGFAFLLFGVMQFHLGIKVTPVAPGCVGWFAIPKVMRALARGAECIDLSEGWTIWPDAGRPLADIRAAYGVR